MRRYPPVRVVPEGATGTTGRWFACCTKVVWVKQLDGDWVTVSCNWYGPWRDTIGSARNDAARHRRAHREDPRYSPRVAEPADSL